jgi:acyl-CoA thioesterase-2
MIESLPLNTPLAPIERLHTLLDLQPTGVIGEFHGPSEWMSTGRVFGGQLLGQAIMAAARLVDDDRVPHTLQMMFVRGGETGHGVAYRPRVLHAGRSFTQLQVEARQDGELLATAFIAFQRPGAGVSHTTRPVKPLPAPESLRPDDDGFPDPDAADPIARILNRVVSYRPFDIRHDPSSVFTTVDDDRPRDEHLVWMRARGSFPGDQTWQRAALAYVSDFTILEPGMRRHGISWSHRGLSQATLNHSMWFLRNVDVEQWIASPQHSPSAQEGRSLDTGEFYAADGTLLATCAQEGLMRIPEVR